MLPSFFSNIIEDMKNNTANILAVAMPPLSWNLDASETNPTMLGPSVHPISPPSASRANIAVPPCGRFFDAESKVPGQVMLTVKPHIAHAMSDTTALLLTTATI